ncbi:MULTISPECIES: hypothetical protein [unclassified Glutamicibacter]|uniref:hypothetical protein n=1 Tax=unclassified Glutamicibacter TaxID=2627139 RepID=UPI003830D11B
MPTAVAEQNNAEKYLEASIERFLATRPVFTDDMRGRLAAALAMKSNEAFPEKAGSEAA